MTQQTITNIFKYNAIIIFKNKILSYITHLLKVEKNFFELFIVKKIN